MLSKISLFFCFCCCCCFLSCQFLIRVFFQKLVAYSRQWYEEYHANDTEQVATDEDGDQRPQRGKTYGAAYHMRVDKLVLDELHDLVDDDT